MSTFLTTDRATDIILDFVAGGVAGNPVGESRGNYDAVIGDADSKDDLSTKTIAEVMAIGLRRHAAGQPSTAMGRYQIVHDTMITTINVAPKILLTEKFTHEVQDKLGWRLLIRRGYPTWWKGTLDDRTFAHNISCEWASLPDPDNPVKDKDGTIVGYESHYHGVGNNRAATKLDDVYAMLRGARQAIAGPEPTPTPPDPEPHPADLAAVNARIDAILAEMREMSDVDHQILDLLKDVFRPRSQPG